MNENNITLPKAYLDRMKQQLGDRYDDYLSCFEKKSIRGVRVNLKRISAEKFETVSGLTLKKLPFCDDGYELFGEEKLGNTPCHLSGLYYLQEPSSMIPVAASGIERENTPLRVLDLCASPGGKTGQIAQRVSDDSIIISNEIIKSRADVLFSNVERQGLKNVIITNEEPSNLLCFEGYFDYVFVDAPCSGEGMFRKNPETIGQWSEKNVTMCQKRQFDILEVAQKLVKPGGKLIYSTCTFSPEEDEEVVDYFARNFNYKIVSPPSEVQKVTIPSKATAKGGEFARKFYPFSGSGEGQFFCVFEREGDDTGDKLYAKKHLGSIFPAGRAELKLFDEFCAQNMKEKIMGRIFLFKNNLFLVPPGFDDKLCTALDSLRVLSIGVNLGNVEKRRFEPSHSFFMTFFDNFKEKIEVENENLKKYLHGDELSCGNFGVTYAPICSGGYPLGGGKISAGKVKNLYPKGLRI